MYYVELYGHEVPYNGKELGIYGHTDHGFSFIKFNVESFEAMSNYLAMETFLFLVFKFNYNASKQLKKDSSGSIAREIAKGSMPKEHVMSIRNMERFTKEILGALSGN